MHRAVALDCNSGECVTVVFWCVRMIRESNKGYERERERKRGGWEERWRERNGERNGERKRETERKRKREEVARWHTRWKRRDGSEGWFCRGTTHKEAEDEAA